MTINVHKGLLHLKAKGEVRGVDWIPGLLSLPRERLWDKYTKKKIPISKGGREGGRTQPTRSW